ncbi:MAG TPA: shikimate dehydrogenase [Acidothermaceae bacterium]|nr:shikimate dehydrogenase [Acidothermaceae bacterium]
MTDVHAGRRDEHIGAGRRAAVLGSPIAHSLSPVLHRAAYADLGLSWTYDAIECDVDQLAELLTTADDAFVGLSLTMPLKRAVLPLCDELSPLAAAVGAANTVTFEGVGPFRRRRGDNTDVGGMVGAIRATGLPDGPVAILGAGGTAAAALAAVRDLGRDRAAVVVRDPLRAADLLGAADRLGVAVTLAEWPGVDVVARAGSVISTVPAGAADSISGVLRPGQLLFDVVYDPWPTPLARAADEAGARVIGGLELLIRQAALQVEIWSGLRLSGAPLGAMKAAGEAALRERASRSAG